MRKQRSSSTFNRQRRLVGGLVDFFDWFQGKHWATLLGALILLILMVISFLPL